MVAPRPSPDDQVTIILRNRFSLLSPSFPPPSAFSSPLVSSMPTTHTLTSPEELIHLASELAAELQGGEVFALDGDLGLGKTTFVKGLAQGLGSAAIVTSPTFNLVHRYSDGRLSLIHYDLYRLKKLTEIEALDLDAELETNHILAIEWPQLIAAILPQTRTRWVKFEEINASERKVTISNT